MFCRYPMKNLHIGKENVKMKRKVLISGYAVCMLAVFCWLALSNQAFLHLSGNEPIVETSLEEYELKDAVTCAVDEMTCSDDLFSTLTVRGWAFVETDEDNQNGWTDILLVNEKHCYKLGEWQKEESYHKSRADVTSAYSDRRIPSNLVGFVNRYCAFEIEDGEYKIYMYRYANEKNYGLGKSNAVFYKNGKNVELTYEY